MICCDTADRVWTPDPFLFHTAGSPCCVSASFPLPSPRYRNLEGDKCLLSVPSFVFQNQTHLGFNIGSAMNDLHDLG